uniref:Uncharacterized protein n=1 Tax=Oryza rufipogon TaxID=4529 RepID=A0A0E0RAT2_ORYRU
MDSCGRVMADEDFVEERRFWAWENHRGFLVDVGASVEYEEDDDYDYDGDHQEMDWDNLFPTNNFVKKYT